MVKARQSVLNKFKRLGYLMEDISFVQICEEQDSNFLMQILQNKKHALHQLLSPVRNVYPRAHDREVPVSNATMMKNFINRMLYSDSLMS